MADEDISLYYQTAGAALWNAERNRNAPTTEFYARLMEIDYEAVELRQDAIDTPIGLTGYSALEALDDLEDQCGDLHQELVNARRAVDHHQPYEFDRVESGFDSEDQNSFLDKRNKIAGQLNGAFEEVERSRTTITSKRTEAITRISTVFSLGILTVSAITLLVSVLL